MKIHQLLSGFDMQLTNEEYQFVNDHSSLIRLSSLDSKDEWMAQRLVRKGVYSIGEDSNTLISNLNDTNTRRSL